MKHIYEVKVESAADSGSRNYLIYRPNVIEAAKAAMRAYRKEARNGHPLLGHARVTEIKDTGTLDG